MSEAKDKQQQTQKGPKSGKPSADEIAAKKAAKKASKASIAADEADETPSTPAPPPRLIAHYKEKVVPALQQRFGYTNNLAVPRIEKIVISMGLGKAATAGAKEKINKAEKELAVIAGQMPVSTQAKKSVAKFKDREG